MAISDIKEYAHLTPSALAAPISCAGTVLSYPPSRTTASKREARLRARSPAKSRDARV
jgi:hypothetical protein